LSADHAQSRPIRPAAPPAKKRSGTRATKKAALTGGLFYKKISYLKR
jgi:hypothetical protein